MTHSKITAKLNDKGELVFLAYKEPKPLSFEERFGNIGNVLGRESFESAINQATIFWQQSAVEYRAFDDKEAGHIMANVYLGRNNSAMKSGGVDVTAFVEIREYPVDESKSSGQRERKQFGFYKPQEPLSGVSEGKEESQDELWNSLMDEWNWASLDDYAGKDVLGYLKSKFTIKRK